MDKKYEYLLEKIKTQNPLLAEAIKEVDETLIHEFSKLSFIERIDAASGTAIDLEKFSNQ